MFSSIDGTAGIAAVTARGNTFEQWTFYVGNPGTKLTQIAKSLTHAHNVVSSIHLSGRGVDDEGALALSAALQHRNSKLEVLDLSNNDIGETGARAIARALQCKTNRLRVLNLSGNAIGSLGVIALCEALEHGNCKLEQLRLNKANLMDGDAMVISTALLGAKSSKLLNLSLCENGIGDLGASALAKALATSACKMQTIALSHNEIGDEGASALLRAMLYSNTLLGIDLVCNVNNGSTLIDMNLASQDVQVFRTIWTLLLPASARQRFGRSPLRRLPNELVRLVAQMLPVQERYKV